MGLEVSSYKEMLDRLGLFSLEGDLMELYKIKRGTEKVNNHSNFSRAGGFRTRGY